MYRVSTCPIKAVKREGSFHSILILGEVAAGLRSILLPESVVFRSRPIKRLNLLGFLQ
jgi:hypothetical protein